MNRLFKKICAGMMIATMVMSTCMVSYAENIIGNGSFENQTHYGEDGFVWEWTSWGPEYTPEGYKVADHTSYYPVNGQYVFSKEDWIQKYTGGKRPIVAEGMDGNYLHSGVGRYNIGPDSDSIKLQHGAKLYQTVKLDDVPEGTVLTFSAVTGNTPQKSIADPSESDESGLGVIYMKDGQEVYRYETGGHFYSMLLGFQNIEYNTAVPAGVDEVRFELIGYCNTAWDIDSYWDNVVAEYESRDNSGVTHDGTDAGLVSATEDNNNTYALSANNIRQKTGGEAFTDADIIALSDAIGTVPNGQMMDVSSVVPDAEQFAIINAAKTSGEEGIFDLPLTYTDIVTGVSVSVTIKVELYGKAKIDANDAMVHTGGEAFTEDDIKTLTSLVAQDSNGLQVAMSDITVDPDQLAALNAAKTSEQVGSYDVTYTYVDPETGIVVSKVVSIHLTDDATLTIQKVWSGDNTLVRPDSIDVDIMADGELYKTVQLTADNNWSYTEEVATETSETIATESNATEIATQSDAVEETATPSSATEDEEEEYIDGLIIDDVNAAGIMAQGIELEIKDINWSVVEHTVNNYTSNVTQDGTAFTVTNTYNVRHESSDNDSSSSSSSSSTLGHAATPLAAGPTPTSDQETVTIVDYAAPQALGVMEAALPKTGEETNNAIMYLIMAMGFIMIACGINKKRIAR